MVHSYVGESQFAEECVKEGNGLPSRFDKRER